MPSIPHAPPARTHTTALVLRAERARTLAEIHQAVCRARRQSVLCSTCQELNARAAVLAAQAGATRARGGCQVCGYPHADTEAIMHLKYPSSEGWEKHGATVDPIDIDIVRKTVQ